MEQTQAFAIFAFSHNFSIWNKFTIPMFLVLEIVWIYASCKKNEKHLTLDCSVCSCFFCPIENHFPHILVTILLTGRLMKIFYFESHFHTNVYVKLFTKEVNLFCSWARPNISILDSFIIEVWKYMQYKRVSSVFYGSASIAIFLWIGQLEFI